MKYIKDKNIKISFNKQWNDSFDYFYDGIEIPSFNVMDILITNTYQINFLSIPISVYLTNQHNITLKIIK